MNRITYSGSIFSIFPELIYDTASYMKYEVELSEEVDIDRLKDAVARAAEDCPYMKYVVRPGEKDGLCSLEEREDPVMVCRELPERIDNGDPCGGNTVVFVSGRRITLLMCHAVTDGWGLQLAFRAILDHYFGKKETLYKGKDSDDYFWDPMEEPFFPDGTGSGTEAGTGTDPGSGTEAGTGDERGTIIPETGGAEEEEYLILDRSDLKSYCEKKNVSVLTAMTLFTAKALQRLFPEDQRDISVRMPVNARRLLGKENTFQNASIPNLRLRLTPGEIGGEEDVIFRRVKEQMEEQLKPERLFIQFDQWREVLFEKNMDAKMKMIRELSMEDTVYLTYFGSEATGPEYGDRISGVWGLSTFCPLTFTMIAWRDKLGLFIHDRIRKKGFSDLLLKVLEEYGIYRKNR